MFTTVLLTEDALTDHDVERLAHLHDPEPVSILVLVPAVLHRNALVDALDDIALGQLRDVVVDEPDDPSDDRTAAARALESSVAALRTVGVHVEGALLDGDAVDGTVAHARRVDADEIVVVTPPHLVEETFYRDWASRLRRELKLPVLHVVAGTDRVL